MPPLIDDNLAEIGQLCRLHGVRKLEVFGSILRSDFDPQHSDVDVLVEFEPQVASSFANFLDLKEALEGLLRRPVDLVELHTIRNRRLRHYVEHNRVTRRKTVESGLLDIYHRRRSTEFLDLDSRLSKHSISV
jgi:predicted nucleotidyltransferase